MVVAIILGLIIGITSGEWLIALAATIVWMVVVMVIQPPREY